MDGLFILGGSTYYTLLLLKSLKAQNLLRSFSRIAVFGRNPERLDLIATAGGELVDHQVPIIATDRIEDCLDPSYTIIFNQMRMGGLDARDKDEKAAIAARMPADETIGIVGASNAIRTIKGLAPFAEALRAKQSPYTFLNFTNPCSIVCQYLTERLDAQVIGICDYPAFMRREIANKMGVQAQMVSLDYFGLNHFGFIHGVQIDGREVLADVIAAKPSFMPDCNRYFSTLLNISWSFVFENERLVEKQSSKPNRANTLLDIEQQCDVLLASKETDAQAYLGILAQRNCDWYDLAVSPVLGHLTGETSEQVFVNCDAGDALNLGCEHSIIEASSTIDPKKVVFDVVPSPIETLPEYMLVRLMKQAELKLLEGIVEGDPDTVIEACLLNPMIRSLDKTTDYFGELQKIDPIMARFWESGS
ncbi:MAG: 6-phospho-beta-glucosidase [Pseudomonadota bacterium]